ncbi:MAG: hypothetical protein WDN27_02150 [Candidatus Saccharibacteria bacterium]
MLIFILGLILAAVAIMLWTLWRAYEQVPAKELKRLARAGDDVAELLYRAAAYGMSLRVLLAGGAVVFGALSLVCLGQAVGLWLAIVIMLVLLAVGGFTLVPNAELTRSSLWLAKRAAPVIAWLLERLQPVLDWVARFVRKHRPVYLHTGIYEKSDLVELLEHQKEQPDNRISDSEIDLLRHALMFGDKWVSDALVPKRVVKSIAASEAVGPILMDELSKSGHSRFPPSTTARKITSSASCICTIWSAAKKRAK